jgi:hypothetical protein
MTSLYPFDDRSHGERLSCPWCGAAIVALFIVIALVL